VRFDVVFLN
jgi:hypothetical protein